ncbi:hypothetical protein [Nocardioides aurantiacus]|uniref:Uncharacterized protein n=1 Tax=Nocardioides aurantiacus TaxID=86796 RepID=A0A3N2CPM4_9ACTN|nr:hypothetical protein [Nocardioides aurantiacus]ROR89356.1 hypothetical protein EDD33_0176 [Nocardioides aurantiacus]
MVSIDTVLQWQPGTLGDVADVLSRKRKKLVDLQDEMDGSEPPTTWVAGSASRARTSHEKLRLRLLDMAAEVSDVTVNLDDAQTRIKEAKQSLQDALSSAASQGFEVDKKTGAVKDPRTYTNTAERDAIGVLVDQVSADIDAALQAAQEADMDLAKALTAAVDGKTDGGTGSLSDAINQRPVSMDDLSPEELAALLGEDVTVHTISAYLELEAELGSFEFEGKAQADYKVMADGTTILALHLEGGLGREIEVGGTEADVGAGGTTDLELKFDTPQEAQEFLENLREEAFHDIGVWDVATGDAPIEIARNVASYVNEQDIDSFRTGVYASGEMEFDSPWARGAVEGRAEAYYDWAKDQYGLKVEASVDAELGQRESGYNAAASLAGEIKIDDDGKFDSFTLSGKMDGTAANSTLGIAAPPGTSTGAGVDVQLKVDDKNPALDEIKTALSQGDVDRAKDLALQNGELTVRQTMVEKYAEDDYELDLKFAEVEAGWGASGETATTIWHREAGRDEMIRVNPATDLPHYGGWGG